MIKTIAVGISAVAMLTALPAQAQSLLDIAANVVGKRLESKRMKATCERLADPALFIASVAGDDVGHDDAVTRPSREQLLARQIMAPAEVTLTYGGWTEEREGGRGICNFLVSMRLPPAIIAKANASHAEQEMGLVLVQRGRDWTVDSIGNTNGFGVDMLREQVRPYLSRAVTDLLEQQDARAAAQAQIAAAQAAATRAEWIRTHPAEYAEQQRRARVHAGQLLNLLERSEQVRQRGQRTCAANGGVWVVPRGRDGNVQMGPPYCQYANGHRY